VSVATDVAEQIADVLAGRPARWAVNTPPVAEDEVALVVPYQELARRMGSLWAQLGGGSLREVEITYQGDVGSVHTAAISAALLSGMLSPFSQDRVTTVNAMEMASRHGVEVREQRSSRSESFAGSIGLRAKGRGPAAMEGTLVLGEPRVIRLEDMHIDLLLDGAFLMLSHRDRPGLIGEMGRLLGTADINIAEMQVGRDRPRGTAVTAIRVDEPVPDSVVDELVHIPGVESVHKVEIGSLG
jgi:D-3-phosphoglycerate dehydrogenase